MESTLQLQVINNSVFTFCLQDWRGLYYIDYNPRRKGKIFIYTAMMEMGGGGIFCMKC